MVDQVLIIYAGTRGHLDKIPVNRSARLGRRASSTFMLNQKSEVREELATKKDLSDDLIKKIEAVDRRVPSAICSRQDRPRKKKGT